MVATNYMAQARAKYDFRQGEGRDSNPFVKGTDSNKAWQKQMDRLHDLEMERWYYQGIAESHYEEHLNG